MSVKLTEYEQEMLDGKHGKAKQVAMQGVVKYAEILGAEELVEITKAHFCCGSNAVPADFPDGDLNKEEFLKMDFADWVTKPECPQMDPDTLTEFNEDTLIVDDVNVSDYYQYEATQQTKEFWQNNRDICDEAAEKGVIIGSTCAPYLAGWLPTMGEYFVTTESSNVLYCNTVLGARGNGGGQSTTFISAVCGRAPKWGLHLDENRHGTHVFNIKTKAKTKIEWDMMGYAIGRRLSPNAIPVLRGDFDRPDLIKLKTFFTSLATTSGCEMCLIVGLSPEAPTYEAAMKGHEPVAEFDITPEILEGYRKEVCYPESAPVDFLQIGCPNCSCEEIKRIARYMKGKKVKEGVRFLVFTNIAQYAMAQTSHLDTALKECGIDLVTSGCILRCVNIAYGSKGIGLSSAKLAHYSKTERDVPVFYGTEEEVCDAAVSGYWHYKDKVIG